MPVEWPQAMGMRLGGAVRSLSAFTSGAPDFSLYRLVGRLYLLCDQVSGYPYEIGEKKCILYYPKRAV